MWQIELSCTTDECILVKNSIDKHIISEKAYPSLINIYGKTVNKDNEHIIFQGFRKLDNLDQPSYLGPLKKLQNILFLSV